VAADDEAGLGRLQQLLAVNRDNTGYLDQAALIECGNALLAHLNASDESGVFAVINILNVDRAYLLAGAASNLAMWEQVLAIADELLPTDAYAGRIDIGLVVHAWGPDAPVRIPRALVAIQEALRAVEMPDSSHGTLSVVLASRAGYLVYPADCGPRTNSSDITRRVALSAIDLTPQIKFSTLRRFDESLIEVSQADVETELSLSQAVSDGDFEMHLQPQLDLISGRVIGAEALARFTTRGLSPDRTGAYIGIIEESGFAPEFTVASFAKTVDIIAAHQDLWPPGFRISFNLSRAVFQWAGTDIVTMVINERARCRHLTNLLTIEITESFNDHPMVAAAANAQFEALRDLGVRIAIDDFGSGFGALRLLSSRTPAAVKLDRSVTAEISERPHDSMFLRSLIAAASLTGLDIMCEGIETKNQRDQLVRAGVHLGQGYLFSPALDADAFIEYLSSHQYR
jgi:EAL domain-containing protein (putative c-di-GMP-specific phosphodiesterase class I)